VEEEIRDIQKYLNDIRHNFMILLSDRDLEYVPYTVLENSNQILNVVDKKLNNLKNYSVEPPRTQE
jgi:hypothetical protein